MSAVIDTSNISFQDALSIYSSNTFDNEKQTIAPKPPNLLNQHNQDPMDRSSSDMSASELLHRAVSQLQEAKEDESFYTKPDITNEVAKSYSMDRSPSPTKLLERALSQLHQAQQDESFYGSEQEEKSDDRADDNAVFPLSSKNATEATAQSEADQQPDRKGRWMSRRFSSQKFRGTSKNKMKSDTESWEESLNSPPQQQEEKENGEIVDQLASPESLDPEEETTDQILEKRRQQRWKNNPFASRFSPPKENFRRSRTKEMQDPDEEIRREPQEPEKRRSFSFRFPSPKKRGSKQMETETCDSENLAEAEGVEDCVKQRPNNAMVARAKRFQQKVTKSAKYYINKSFRNSKRAPAAIEETEEYEMVFGSTSPNKDVWGRKLLFDYPFMNKNEGDTKPAALEATSSSDDTADSTVEPKEENHKEATVTKDKLFDEVTEDEMVTSRGKESTNANVEEESVEVAAEEDVDDDASSASVDDDASSVSSSSSDGSSEEEPFFPVVTILHTHMVPNGSHMTDEVHATAY